MAQAYVPIQTVTVGSGGAASIEFTNIPQTYTDLKIVYSTRNTGSADPWYQILIQFNSDTTAANYPYRYLYNASGTPGSGTGNQAVGYSNSGSATASTFSNGEIYIPNYTSTTNKKSISGDVVNENNSSTNVQALYATLWDGTAAAITSIKLTQNANNFAQYSTATLYGIGGTRASGGTVTADGRYTYHTFTSTGTFTALEKIKGAEILAIAGGGGGGGQPDSGNSTGGGGAGGVLYTAGQLLSAGSSYSVIVGSGGSGGSAGANSGSKGSNSTFASLSAEGGGLGGHNANGGNGGSGGGGKSSGGTATSGQGNDGAAAGANFQGGGGGGAGAAGSTNGNGGVGTTTYSSWGYATSTGVSSGGMYYYAGGGGGGQYFYTDGSGIGGLGGGGNGGRWNGSSVTAAVAGTANTGGGGGGAGSRDGQGAKAGAAGGSGLVIIRYQN